MRVSTSWLIGSRASPPIRALCISLVALFLCQSLGLVAVPRPAYAHAGHDEAPPSIDTTLAPRAEAHSPDFELVATARGDRLEISLDRYADNTPVPGATVEVTAAGTTARATEQAEGVYSITAPWLVQSGSHDVVFAITAGETVDLLISQIVVPAAPSAAPAAPGSAASLFSGLVPPEHGRLWLVGAGMFALGVLVTLLVTRRGRARAIAGGLAVVIMLILANSVAFAHGDEEHGAPAASPATTPRPAGQTGTAPVPLGGASESPRQLPDGSVFVPKSAQRLFDIRTTLTAAGTAAETLRTVGQIVPDPNRSGLVQAPQGGRIELNERGLPALGQRVRAGDVLAYLVPTDLAPDRGTILPLVASATGVISVAEVAAGQVVDPRQLLFQIIDPRHLRVEVLAFEPTVIDNVVSATAVTGDGRSLPLAFVGRGLTLRQHAIPLQFRIIDPPGDLSVGQPVTVLVHTHRWVAGLILPAGAVRETPGGQAQVWEHTAAERFVSHPVRVEPIDGESVLVVAGLDPGRRIVVSGAGLLDQIR